ncbi:hypothetical protein N7490_003375 [Penicillium lividum]|nr:hypothetical protein N7490_003375 [Penicillium lividum]
MFVAAALRMFNRGKTDDSQVLVALRYEEYLGYDEMDGLISGEQSERRKARYSVGRSSSRSGGRFFRRRSYTRLEEQNVL